MGEKFLTEQDLKTINDMAYMISNEWSMLIPAEKQLINKCKQYAEQSGIIIDWIDTNG